VPVVTVKSTQSPICEDGTRRGMRPSRGGAKHGITIVVCVDATNLASMALEMALNYAHKPDKVVCLHIENTDKAVGNLRVENEADVVKNKFVAECGKLVQTGAVAEAMFEMVPKTKSIKEHVLEFLEHHLADIVVMGSAELSKQSKKDKLGSVCSGVARESYAHACIVKNFNVV